MNKRWICALTAFALISSHSCAEEPTQQLATELEELLADDQTDLQNIDRETPAEEEEAEESGKPVTKAPENAPNPIKKQRIRNICVAVGAIAIAATALVLVSLSSGHH